MCGMEKLDFGQLELLCLYFAVFFWDISRPTTEEPATALLVTLSLITNTL